MRKAAQAWLQYGRDLDVRQIERALSAIDDESADRDAEIVRLGKYRDGLATNVTELEAEVERLKQRLALAACPRPANAAPPGPSTIAACVARGECGCDLGEPLRYEQKADQG